MKALRILGNILIWPLAVSKPLDRLLRFRALIVLRKILFGLILVLFWLLILILAGGLGPIVTHLGAPIANAFGVPLTVEKCVILPLGGYVRIDNLAIGNPETFVAANPKVYADTPLVKIGHLECDVAMRSLLSKEIAVDTLELTGLRALYAYDLDTTNVDALLAQMGIQPAAETAPAAGQKPDAEPKAPDAEREAPAKEPAKFRLAYVHIEDNSVSVRKFVTIPVALPALTLRDIDSDDLKTRIDAIVQPVVKTVHGAAEGIGALGAALGDGAKDLGTGAKDLGAGAKDALDEGAKAVGGLLDGLFGGSKKDN